MELAEQSQLAQIFSFGLQMTITFVAGIMLWTLRIAASKTDTIDWYRANGLRLVIAFFNFWVIAAGLVVVPNFAEFLGSLGLNADRSTVGIAFFIILLFIKTEAKPDHPLEVAVVPRNEE